MSKLQRPTDRRSKQRESIDFKFSNFQALQVPKGWDRLFISLISVETGKTLAKSGKALVKNGTCQWTETLSESIYIPRDDSSKGYEECLVKLLVSTGSTRSNILGEATIDVSNYTGSKASVSVSQPLKKCTYGIVLQFKIQRLIPRSKTGDAESKNTKSQEEGGNVDRLDTDTNSYRSESSSESTGKAARDHRATTSRPLKSDSKEGCESSSGAVRTFHSQEGSTRREDSSLKNASKSEEYSSPERRDDGLVLYQDSVDDGDFPSIQPSATKEIRSSMMMSVGSSRNLLEVAEDAIEELRAEAKMWERNARKLMIDLDISRNEFSNLSKKHAELEMELSASHAEHDGLKREIEKLKLDAEKFMTNLAAREDPIVESRKEMESEIRYQQELNDDLGQQLRRSQESNLELVSVLQELEVIIEQQRIEIENLSSVKLNITDLESSVARNSAENRLLSLQLQQVQEAEKKLQADIESLEGALRDKSDELENERKANGEILSQGERDYEYKISIKEEEVVSLEAKLSREYEKNEHLVREIESLGEKVHELEKDCTELTDENLELLFKLKDANKTGVRKCSSSDSDESEVSDPKYRISQLEDELKKERHEEAKNAEILELLDVAFHLLKKPWCGVPSDENETCRDFVLSSSTNEMSADHVLSFVQETNKLLETRITEGNKILRRYESEIGDRNNIIADLEESKAKSEEAYANLVRELEAEVFELQQQKSLLEQDIERGRETVSSHVSASKDLERKLELLERKRDELENTLSGLREENTRLQECSSELEGQLQQLREEKGSCLQETDNLKDETRKLKAEMEVQVTNLERESEDVRKQCQGTQEELEHLKEENKILQASAANSVREIVELKRENEELHERCSVVMGQLNQSKKSLSDAYKEKERISILSSGEVSSLLADKAELEAQLQEVRSEAESNKNKLGIALQESEILTTEHERILRLLMNYKKSEEKLKSELNDLELRHTMSDYEHEQLTKEMGVLKVQLQNMSGLHEEISMLKSELKGCKAEKGKLEIALHTISGDYEELKMVKFSLSETISVLHDALSEFMECKRNKLSLEEKLMKLEKDLSAKEIICIQNADLKNELAETKKANTQLQKKMYMLEEERDKCLKKAQALEENVKHMEERNNINNEGWHNHDSHDQDPLSASTDNATRFLHESGSSKKSSAVTRERYERKKSSLEIELRDLRERYLEMSLKYAEVEAEREDLFMKLKATRGGKRWFS